VREGIDAGVLAAASREAFEDFYVTEYRAVVGLAYVLSGDRSIAEDLAQEAFLAAHRNWSRIARYERPGAWVRRVVVNLSASALRRRFAEARALVRLTPREAPAAPELSASDAEFWAALRSLPRRQAQVAALFYVDDRPVAEIAEILDMAVGTVKKHLHDARRRLSEALRLEDGDA